MRIPLLLAAFGVQIAGALIAFALIWLAHAFAHPSLLAAAAMQGLCAALVSWKTGAPRWWHLIHLAFMPLAAAALTLGIAPGWWLLMLVLSLLVFWRIDKNRVPLYLSNADTAAAVAKLLPPGAHVADLGCGNGRMLHRLAQARPDCRFTGIEHAPLPWLLAHLRKRNCRNVSIHYGNLWKTGLGDFDAVYVFLSPAPMAALADKIRAEMGNDKLLISNSFSIPDAVPEQKIALTDRRRTQLFCYKTSLRNTAKPAN